MNCSCLWHNEKRAPFHLNLLLYLFFSMFARTRLLHINGSSPATKWNLDNLSSSFDPNTRTAFVFLTFAFCTLFISAYLLYVWFPIVNGMLFIYLLYQYRRRLNFDFLEFSSLCLIKMLRVGDLIILLNTWWLLKRLWKSKMIVSCFRYLNSTPIGTITSFSFFTKWTYGFSLLFSSF
jgi:hypothetical protein